MGNKTRQWWLIGISFFIVYIVWGSTYLTNAWGVKVVPPFLFAGTRFILAGLLLLGWSRFISPIQCTWQQFKNSVIAGFALFAVGNGFVVWALQYVDSGLTALIVSCQPLLVALMIWGLYNEKPNWRTSFGIGLGLIGMYLLIGQPNIDISFEWGLGVVMVLIGVSAWSYMAIWVPRVDLPPLVAQSAALQMIGGGVIMFIISIFLGDFGVLYTMQLTPKVIWSFIYLVLFGSIAAFSAYNYLLLNVSTTKVVTSAYVNPVVALFLGWRFNAEIVTSQSLIAAVILLIGVFFINSAKN